MLWERCSRIRPTRTETTLLILPGLGRDGDRNTANGFLNHRSGDPSCRNVWMLALEAGLEKGEADRPISHVDIAATAAAVLGVPGGEMGGGACRKSSSDRLRVECARESTGRIRSCSIASGYDWIRIQQDSRLASTVRSRDPAHSCQPLKNRAARGASRRRDVPCGHRGLPAASKHSVRRTADAQPPSAGAANHPV